MRYIFQAVPTKEEWERGYNSVTLEQEIDPQSSVDESMPMYRQFLLALGYQSGSVSWYLQEPGSMPPEEDE